METKPALWVVLGPTASGKTRFAVQLAAELGGEILSADSRQVYQGMDIGTGKDLSEYRYQGRDIPYHLIDLVSAGTHYNLYRYMQDFHKAYAEVLARGAVPILCGGSGMYIEAVCKGYNLPEVPENKALRERYAPLSHPELVDVLASFGPLHNSTDTESRKRLIRAIEIAEWKQQHPESYLQFPPIEAHIIGLNPPVEVRRERIARRLDQRLQEGLVDEARRLMEGGLSVEDMMYYGLEYKFLALYLTEALSYDEMKTQLNIAIRQFAKRQMTWFRGMERRGFQIHWQ